MADSRTTMAGVERADSSILFAPQNRCLLRWSLSITKWHAHSAMVAHRSEPLDRKSCPGQGLRQLACCRRSLPESCFDRKRNSLAYPWSMPRRARLSECGTGIDNVIYFAGGFVWQWRHRQNWHWQARTRIAAKQWYATSIGFDYCSLTSAAIWTSISLPSGSVRRRQTLISGEIGCCACSFTESWCCKTSSMTCYDRHLLLHVHLVSCLETATTRCSPHQRHLLEHLSSGPAYLDFAGASLDSY